MFFCNIYTMFCCCHANMLICCWEDRNPMHIFKDYQICLLRFVCLDLFLQICFFRFVSSDLFLQICVLQIDFFIFRFARFVQICFVVCVYPDSLLCIVWILRFLRFLCLFRFLRFLKSLRFIRLFRLISFFIISQICQIRVFV